MTQESERAHDRIILTIRQAIPERMSLDECAELTGASKELIERLVEEEVIQMSEVLLQEGMVDRPGFEILERSLRLHHELGVNIAGIVIIERLLHQLQEVAMHRQPDDPAIEAKFE